MNFPRSAAAFVGAGFLGPAAKDASNARAGVAVIPGAAAGVGERDGGGEGIGVATATCDFRYQDRVRTQLPCLSHRKL